MIFLKLSFKYSQFSQFGIKLHKIDLFHCQFFLKSKIEKGIYKKTYYDPFIKNFVEIPIVCISCNSSL